MRQRIAGWAAAGFLIASCWLVYLSARSFPLTSGETMIYALARLSQPVVSLGSYFHFGIRFYWVILANTATYALVGLLAESVRKKLHPAH